MTVAPPFACPACGGSEARPWCAAPDPRGAVSGTFTLVRCVMCGCGAVWPQPDDAMLAAAYKGEYAPHAAPGAHDEPGLARRIPRGRPGRALVVGAGSGSNLARLRAAAWTVVGIEPDAGAVARAREAGLDVTQGTAEAGPYPDGTFDLVWLPSVLEHVRDPVAALREAGRRLVPGGRVEVWTQNPDSWTARRFGPDWIHLDPPRHLWHLSRVALTRLAERGGLHVASCRTRSRPRGWLASAEIRAARAGHPRDLRRSRWRKALVRPWCWLADWCGAGDGFEVGLRRARHDR